MDTSQTPVALKTFVIIFRQAGTLSESDTQRRAQETGAWARHQNAGGHKLDPRILASERAHPRPDHSAAAAAPEWPITALLFLEAHDLAEAAQIAGAHPGLRYGADVEVRPWAPPTPVAPTTKPPAAP
jgi:hypothetical protein